MAIWQRLRDRIGHRGAFLLFLVVLDLSFGYSLLTLAPARAAFLYLFLPVTFWGITWIVVGAVCAVGAFVRRDRLAYAAAAGLKAAWAAVSLRAWILHDIPQGWVAVVVWGAFGLTVLLIASWPEMPPPPRVPPAPVVDTKNGGGL